jgi:hypothetical protein
MLERARHRQRPRVQELLEALALEQLHHHEHAVGLGADVEHFDHVGMADARDDARLAQEALLGFRVVPQPWV